MWFYRGLEALTEVLSTILAIVGVILYIAILISPVVIIVYFIAKWFF